MKRIVTFALMSMFLLSLAGCGDNANTVSLEVPKPSEIKLSQADFDGLKYFDVYSQLEADGFTNISTEALNDLTSAEENQDDVVDRITIDGSDTYQVGTSYLSDVEIKIYYHNIKMVFVPFSSEERPEDELYDSILKQFEDAGFVNVKGEPIEDLVFGWLTEDGEIETILIDGSETFEELDLVAFDTEVVIRYHTFPMDDSDEQGNDEATSDATETTEITVSMNEDDFMGMNYAEAERLLRDMGFTVFEYEILETDDQAKPDDTIGAVEIKNWEFGKGDFSIGDTYATDAIVVLWYYECEEQEPNLTVDNCEDLAVLLSVKDPQSDIVSSFAAKYSGRTIEFDGNVAFSANHGDYDTRYDVLVYAGDYNENSASGPNFQFVDVNYGDLGLSFSDYIEDYISIGTNLHIIAEVDDYNENSGLFELDPISIELR